MENTKKDRFLNLDRLATYVGIFAFIFLFWSYWRDIHIQISDVKERIAVVETEIKHMNSSKPVLEKENNK